MPSTLFGMKLMLIHILVLGNSFFKLELDNLWDTNKIQKIGKKGFQAFVFFLYSFSLRGGLRQSNRWLNTRVEPSIAATFWWKIGWFFTG